MKKELINIRYFLKNGKTRILIGDIYNDGIYFNSNFINELSINNFHINKDKIKNLIFKSGFYSLFLDKNYTHSKKIYGFKSGDIIFTNFLNKFKLIMNLKKKIHKTENEYKC